MNIGIIDADLLDNGTRHPNLALMKISAYNKEQGHNVKLLDTYNNIQDYDNVYLSKVFDFTEIPVDLAQYSNVITGGTGLYWDQSPELLYEVEHHMPDYHLYDEYIGKEIARGIKKSHYEDYMDYSIGFLTRGCFNKCPFCVNQRYNKVFKHSPLSEFLDMDKKYIYLWDDNFLGYAKWQDELDQLEDTGKYFQFKQGLDLRLVTEEKAKRFSQVKCKGDYIFAFDNIADREIIEIKLKLWKSYCSKTTKLYVFCGFDRDNKYDMAFWKQDIIDTFERVKILMQYGCLSYIMRHVNYEDSPYRGIYINLARWCNQPNFYKKKSFREFCEANGESSSTMRYMREFEKINPEIAKQYYNLRFEDLNNY